MNLREPCLPQGWYPRERAKLEEFLKPFAAESLSTDAPAVIAPHAGWYYSGVPAAMAISCLDRKAETVALIGGHLPPGMSVLVAEEDGVKTPLGAINIDKQLREEFKKRLASEMNPARPDRYQDNTVEVLLPMVHYFFPKAQLLWLRFPAELSSHRAGKLLAESAAKLGRRCVVIGSTDLTHYGDNYGFSPKGRGKPALDWMKNVNDAAFIAAVLEGDASRVLKHAEQDFAACSAGAALGALGFVAGKAASLGKMNARLLDYRSSADLGDEIPPSFVGYAAIGF